MKTIFVVLLSLFSLSLVDCCGITFHASCEINWIFSNIQCTKVFADIVQQFQSCCAQKSISPNYRNYRLLYFNNRTLNVAGQITFTDGYIDRQEFTFTQSGSDCKGYGCSVSQSLSVYDYCANYCDLRNLVRGLGYTIDEKIGSCSYVPNDDAKCPPFQKMGEIVPDVHSRDGPKDVYCDNQ